MPAAPDLDVRPGDVAWLMHDGTHGHVMLVAAVLRNAESVDLVTIEGNANDQVRSNIRTARVPILGTVTCHRLMIPQLRGALQDVKDAGLAGTIHSYDGCYVPRFIERNPEHAISLHTWGIAIDLDASTNYRGIKGTMDPKVVEIFKRWGFRWGGDWDYTDPMHFELGALLRSPR